MASDINPTLTPTKSLTNFRFWCQKVLPLVYDDSLSYYEVLGKMVVQLNDVIDDVNADTENVLTLKDAFLELQTYVNEFFDDIDQLASYAERAEDAQTAANASAINAAASATNASASSLAAMDARDTAVAAREAAQASANTAATASTNANTKASEAAQSAITAQTAQASASQSATLAATDRSAAQTAASTATTKANEASTSASNAATSAENAAQSKADAEELVDNVQESLDNIQQNTQDISGLNESINDISSTTLTLRVGENVTQYPIRKNHLYRVTNNTSATTNLNLKIGTETISVIAEIHAGESAYYLSGYDADSISMYGNATGTATIDEISIRESYIDLIENIIAPIQYDYIAKKNYEINDYLILTCKLRIVTQPMAQGTQLNQRYLSETTVSDQLKLLKN